MSNTIYELSQRLVKSLDSNYNVIDMDAVLEIITTLEITKITREQLEITRLGKFINQLRRKTGNESLARRSKNLLKKWREMVMPDLVPNNTNTGTSGTKIKITNVRVHQAATIINQRLPNLSNNNGGGGGGDCDTSNTTTTLLFHSFHSCTKVTKEPALNTQLISFENLITQAKLNSGGDISNDGDTTLPGKNCLKIAKIPRIQNNTEKSTTRNNDNSLLSNDDTNCSNNSAYSIQEPGIPLLNGLKSIFNTDGSQTSVEKFVAIDKVRNKGRPKLVSKSQTTGLAVIPSSSSSNLFIYHDSLSNSDSVSHFNSNSNKQNTTSLPNTTTILNQESDLTFKNKITPPNYLFQNNSKTSNDTVIIDSSSDDEHDRRKIVKNTKSPVVSTENSRSNVVSPSTAIQNHIQKPEPAPMDPVPPVPPVVTPPAPKRRGRKKGSKGCDYELATLGGFINMGSHYAGTMGGAGATSSIMSDIRHKLTSFSGGTSKKIKTTKELLAEIQSKKLGSSATSSPVLSTVAAQTMKNSPIGNSEHTFLQLSPPDSTNTTLITTNSATTLNVDCNSADNHLSSFAKINNGPSDDLLNTPSNNINSNDDVVLGSSKKLFKNIDDEILYLGEQLPKLEKSAINWTDDDDLIPCTCQLKLVIDSNSSNISSSTCNNNNSDNINNNNSNLLHTSNDLTVILTNNSSKVSNDDVVLNDHGGNLLLNHHQTASISVTIDKTPEFLNNNNNNNNNNVSTKKPIKSIFDVDYDDEIDNNGDNNSSSKHEYYINNLNNSDNISNSNYNITVPIGKTKILSIDVPPPLHSPPSPSSNPQNPSNNNKINSNLVEPSLNHNNENSIQDNLLQAGQDSLLINQEQWTVDEDPNCKAKQFYEINKSLIKDYHMKSLHNYFINNINGNWDNFNKSEVSNLNECEYLKNTNDIVSYVNSPVVPKYNHIDNHKIRKNLLHVKFNQKKSKKLTKKRTKKMKKTDSDPDDDKPNVITPTDIIINSELKLDDNGKDESMVVESSCPINNKNIKKRLHSTSSSSSSVVSIGSKNSTSSSEAGDSSSSSTDDEGGEENNELLPCFNKITDANLTGVNSNGCVFKEWHEIVHVKSYNDEPLTILPYVVID